MSNKDRKKDQDRVIDTSGTKDILDANDMTNSPEWDQVESADRGRTSTFGGAGSGSVSRYDSASTFAEEGDLDAHAEVDQHDKFGEAGYQGTSETGGMSQGARQYPQQSAGQYSGGQFSQQSTGQQSTEGVKQAVAESVGAATGRIMEAAGTVTGQAQQQLGAMTEQAKSQIGDMTSQVKEQTTSAISEHKDVAAIRLGVLASSIRETGRNLQRQDQAAMGQYAETFANQVDKFSDYLRNRNAGDLMTEVQDIARRQPELFLAGSLAVGFLLGRFFKSARSPMLGQSSGNQFGRQQYSSQIGSQFGRAGSDQYSQQSSPDYTQSYTQQSYGSGETSAYDNTWGESR